ncbi:MAG: efflux RND transporter periplasmic adaptor subunit [Bacteroidales bacterium]
MKKSISIGVAIVIVVLLAVWYLFGRDKSFASEVTVAVKQGDFSINVTTTGELLAKKSQDINGPAGLREIRIWQVQISDIIPEGTLVDSGQYVAALDKTEITNRIKDLETELEKLQSQYTKTRLDTSMEMRNSREDLVNLKYGLEEKQIVLDQSKYEPPATIRQATLDLEKSKRACEQAIKNYKLKTDKARADMQDVSASLDQSKRKLAQMNEVLKGFTITAPKSGMLIYKRNWDGSRQGIGTTMNAWENVVATLPNLKEMVTKTYVNEIDISKIKIGQKVQIGVDAFPEKKFTGEVMEVANIGEQMKNSNAKVFEVRIKVNETDSILRPAMTTKNLIITSVIKNVLFLPIESVHNTDSVTYVYSVKHRTRQQVIVGKTNENHIIIIKGLKKSDEVYLDAPEGADKWSLTRLTP